MPTKKDEIIDIAKTCFDPEIPVNIWDLGLIYDIDANADTNEIKIRMTLTAQACPAAQQIPDDLKKKILEKFKEDNVVIEMTFDPPWNPERITEDGKKKLGIETE